MLQLEHKEVQPGIVAITISGKIMLGRESQQLEDLVAELLGRGIRKFVFEIGGVSRIDSTGIGRFISAFNKIAQAGGDLRMAGATGPLRDCFRATRLDTIFQFCPDLAEACAALA